MLSDLRFGLRLLRRNPAFTATAITALALGIGATSAIFSVIYGVLLKPLPYRDPARLVRIYAHNPAERFVSFPLSPADFRDYRAQNGVFEDIATYTRQDQQYGGDRPERLISARVSHRFFHLFGFEPLLGRAFTQEEESTPGGVHSVIVSYSMWKRLLGGAPDAIGRTIELSGDRLQVVGIMPAAFEHIGGGYRLPNAESVDVWLPFNLLGVRNPPRASHTCNTVARLKPGISIESAQQQLNGLAAAFERQYPDDRNWRVQLVPLQDDLTGKSRPTLLILAGAVGFVLLIACVNVANLLLARATMREREMAIRAAVGATRSRLVLQMLTESVTLSVAGGALGLLIAWCGVRALVAYGPADVQRLRTVTLDIRVVAVTAGLSLLTGLLFGSAPARAAASALRRTRPRGTFVVAEIALTFVLLLGAGLLLRSFNALGRVDPGFQSHGVLTLNTTFSYAKLGGVRRYEAFYKKYVEDLAQLPGVTSSGASSNLPWTGAHDDALYEIENRPHPANAEQHAHYVFASPDYLRTIGVPLLAGRGLSAQDHFDAPRVTLISRSLALRHWPNLQDAIGQRISTIHDNNVFDGAMTIVGVVGDVKDAPTDTQPPPVLYIPLLQNPSFTTYIVVRSKLDSSALTAAVQQVTRAAGADLSVQEIRTLDQVVAGSIATQRFALQIFGLFAVVALSLAIIGMYGVMSYTAARRAKEFAIRSALGASPADTLRLMFRQAAQLIAGGLIAGAFAAALLTRLLAGLLYQVRPSDPATFGSVAAIVTGVAAAACLGPAKRALAVDPIDALRRE